MQGRRRVASRESGLRCVRSIGLLWLGLALACAGSGGAPGSASDASDSQARGSAPGEPGGGSATRRTQKFPGAEELEALGARPPALTELGLRRTYVEQWTLEGPFPEGISARPLAAPGALWEEILLHRASERPGLLVPTEAMICAARETGRFLLAHGAMPSTSLGRFMLGSCNASTDQVQYRYFLEEIPAVRSDERVYDHMAEPFYAQLLEVRGSRKLVGGWMGRSGERAVGVIAVGEPKLWLEPVSTVSPPGGVLVLEGEALIPASQLVAQVNRGRNGFAACEAEPLALPRFRVRCEVDPEDPRAWVTLSVVRAGRLLGEGGVALLVWPQGRGPARYAAPQQGAPLLAEDAITARRLVAHRVNELRAEAGLPPLSIAAAQSEVASEVAGHYFAAQFSQGGGSVIDVVALGLMAGWEVDGVVQDAGFTSGWIPGSRDLGLLLSELLELPVGRATLLAPEAQRIAVGPVLEADPEVFTGAVLTTYRLFSEEEHDARAREVYDKLDADRATRGRGRAQLLVSMAERSMLAASAVQGGLPPQDALNELLHEGVQVAGRGLQGWVVETQDLDSIEFPEEFLMRRSLEVAVGVSFHKPAGEAWGRYVVMMLAADTAGQGT